MTLDMMRRRAALLTGIVKALDGRYTAFDWGQGEHMNARRMLRDLGIQLVTETRARKLGHRLKRRAVPVAAAYFGAPIQRHCALYVLGIQTAPDERRKPAGTAP